jgi:hypothetical protein
MSSVQTRSTSSSDSSGMYPTHERSYMFPQTPPMTPLSQTGHYAPYRYAPEGMFPVPENSRQLAPTQQVTRGPPQPLLVTNLPPYTAQDAHPTGPYPLTPPETPCSPTSIVSVDNSGRPPASQRRLAQDENSPTGFYGHSRGVLLPSQLPPVSSFGSQRMGQATAATSARTPASTNRSGPENALEVLRKYDTVFVIDG